MFDDGFFLIVQGNVEDACSLYEQAIAIEKGKEHSQTLPLLFAQYSRFVYLVNLVHKSFIHKRPTDLLGQKGQRLYSYSQKDAVGTLKRQCPITYNPEGFLKNQIDMNFRAKSFHVILLFRWGLLHG